MKNKFYEGSVVPFILLIIIFLIGGFLFLRSGQTPPELESYEIEIYTSPTCPHCRNVKEYVDDNDVEEKLDLGFLDVTRPAYANRMTEACKILKGEEGQCGVPLMHDNRNDTVIEGDTPIIEYLKEELDEAEQTYKFRNGYEEQVLTFSLVNKAYAASEDRAVSTTTSGSNSSTTLLTVIGGAAADSFNPCAWSSLILLVSTLISIKANRKKLIKIGITYITVVFLTYLFIGIGLFSFLTNAPQGWDKTLYLILSILIFIAALIELKDYFWYGKGLSLKIPEKSMGTVKSLMRKSTVPAIIAVGLMISVLEFGCTGGIYVPILAMLSQRETLFRAFLYLILYNFIFVLPLIIILVMVVNGYAYDKIEEFRKNNRRLMRLISGLVMLGLSILLFFQSGIL